MNKAIYLLVLISINSGCSTIQTVGIRNITHPYIGTSRAIKQAKKAWNNYDYYGEFGLYAADVPLCLFADTILVPYDFYKYLKTK